MRWGEVWWSGDIRVGRCGGEVKWRGEVTLGAGSLVPRPLSLPPFLYDVVCA